MTTLTKSTEQMVRQLASLPTDDLGPEHYATLDTLVRWASCEVARWDKAEERKAENDAQRAQRDAYRTAGWMTEAQGRREVRRRSGGTCEHPDGCGQRATEVHHIRGRQIPNEWYIDNLLHLCSEHHRHVTREPDESYKNGSMKSRHSVDVWPADRLGVR